MNKSNIGICSNIMIIKDELNIEYTKHIPGDYVGEIYPVLKDVRSRDQLTKRQQIEMEQYRICLVCGKACAGTHKVK